MTLDGEIGDGFSARSPESAQRIRSAAGSPGANRVASARRRRTDDRAASTRCSSTPGWWRATCWRPCCTTSAARRSSTARATFAGSSSVRTRPVLREDLTLRLDPAGTVEARLLPVHQRGRARRALHLHRARTPGEPGARSQVRPAAGTAAHSPALWPGHAAPRGPRTADPGRGAGGGSDDGALVLSVLGVHTQDSASGDFSLSAPQALRVSGRRAGREHPGHDLGQPVRPASPTKR